MISKGYPCLFRKSLVRLDEDAAPTMVQNKTVGRIVLVAWTVTDKDMSAMLYLQTNTEIESSVVKLAQPSVGSRCASGAAAITRPQVQNLAKLHGNHISLLACASGRADVARVTCAEDRTQLEGRPPAVAQRKRRSIELGQGL